MVDLNAGADGARASRWWPLVGIAAVALAASVATAPAHASVSASGTSIGLRATVSGEPPSQVYLDLGEDHHIPLTPNATRTSFSGAYSLKGSTQYLTAARLVAVYGKDKPGFALRLWPKVGDVSVQFSRSAPEACTEATLKIAERNSSSLAKVEESFLLARSLVGLGTKCSTPMAKRATRAWFDKAYQLVTLAKFFDLDPGASAAEAKTDAAHVGLYQIQADAVIAKRLFAQQTAATSDGDYSLAAGLNKALRDTYGSNVAVMEVAKLNLDSLKVQSKRTAAAIAQAPTPPPPAPVIVVQQPVPAEPPVDL